MAGVLHGSARTTPRVRAELQASQETTRVLAARHGLNPKTVQKWRKRTTTADQPMGPRRPRSTVLTEAEEAIVVEFRRRTLLPLDDVLSCLRESTPNHCRSALHRCLVRHGISRLPKYHDGPTARWMGHIFDRVCRENGIEHRRTKPYHPWTNGQAERMNRTVKDATVKVFHYPDLESLKAHILAFVSAYNFGKHLKRLQWRTPFQPICDAWTKDPAPFKINPHHLIPGPHT